MGYILFKNKTAPILAQAKKLNKNQIEISCSELNTTGFSYFTDSGMTRKLGDYYDYTTLYRVLDESYILSNNGSVYPEPVEPAEPTLRETVNTLNTELINTQLALAESYEQNLALTEELTSMQLAVAELYEMMLTNDSGGDTE